MHVERCKRCVCTKERTIEYVRIEAPEVKALGGLRCRTREKGRTPSSTPGYEQKHHLACVADRVDPISALMGKKSQDTKVLTRLLWVRDNYTRKFQHARQAKRCNSRESQVVTPIGRGLIADSRVSNSYKGRLT